MRQLDLPPAEAGDAALVAFLRLSVALSLTQFLSFCPGSTSPINDAQLLRV